ncbi:hypothetical protein SEA_EMIANNA_6 [Gordonia phage Emianna]|uniref:Uncharacterized protein n=1 Tax=Gordonia phage Emianna TaxID=2315530 RepID=A0A386KG24_9CAUD|nr:hypothetical protein KNU15_gp06 [Gordonia phage Emianna]AYD83391.1 hypothetical protein SEA_EMIANNA_6 [Gordonia phage Emianna]AYD84278.1 hypothetical protein SEA_KURT_6 [Gordonia phage Kurt]
MTDITPIDSAPVFTRTSTVTTVTVEVSGVPDITGSFHSKPIRPDGAKLVYHEAGTWRNNPVVSIEVSGPQVRKDGSESKNRSTFTVWHDRVEPWMLDMIDAVRPSTHPKTDDEGIG